MRQPPIKTTKRRVKLYLDHLYDMHYKVRPVDPLTFTCDDYYMGKATDHGNTIYKKWRQCIPEIFSDDSKPFVVVTGAIGIGKTHFITIAAAYSMYRHMCLRDPHGYYGKNLVGKMVITFFNLTKTLSSGKSFSLLQSYLMSSGWFMERGVIRGEKDKYLEFDLFKYALSSPNSKGFGIQGEDVIIGIMDEVDTPGETIKQKMKVLEAYKSTSRRFESRFIINGCSLGRFFMAASKQEELSFISTYIDTQKSMNRMRVYDFPKWEVTGELDRFSGVKFSVSIGDQYHDPKILSTDDDVKKSIVDGFQVMQIPIEYKDSFEADLVGALREIAGVSVNQVRKSKLFPSEKLLIDCYDNSVASPFSKETFMCGLMDDFNLMSFFDSKSVEAKTPKDLPWFVHGDWGKVNDSFGLAMSCISGYKEVNVERPDGTFDKKKLPIVSTAFVIRFKARKDDQVPFHIIRKFVIDLKSVGYNIVLYSSDLDLASSADRQILERSNISTKYISVDKTVIPYVSFLRMVVEKRWTCYRSHYFHFEAANLEKDTVRMKVDHPLLVKDVEIVGGEVNEMVLEGSKDMCFTGDTKVSLVDGRELSFIDIVNEYNSGKDVWVYSIDADVGIVPVKIKNPHMTQKVNKICEVEIDNGNKIECTTNHRFMLRDGSYKEAKYLSDGESLMPLYKKVDTSYLKGYRKFLNPITNKWHYEHRKFVDNYDSSKIVHHINFNALDNRPCNLVVMSSVDHCKLHASLTNKSKMEKMRVGFAKYNSSAIGRENSRKIGKINAEKFRLGIYKRGKVYRKPFSNFVELLNSVGYKYISGEYVNTKSRVTVECNKGHTFKTFYNNLQQGKMCLICDCGLRSERQSFKHDFVKSYVESEGYKLLSTEYINNRSKIKTKCPNGHIYETTFHSFKDSGHRCNKCRLNHKVVSVKVIDKIVEVYDMEVPGYHNFALSSGVFVHNCDAVVGSIEGMNKYMEKMDPIDNSAMVALFKSLNRDDGSSSQNIIGKLTGVDNIVGIGTKDGIKNFKDVFKRLNR